MARNFPRPRAGDAARAELRPARADVRGSETAGYWDDVAADYVRRGDHALWRRYCDGLYVDLLREWLGGASVQRALKTDLFDEAVGEGLVPALAERAAEVHAVDVSERVVAAAGARYPELRARTGDVRRLEYPDAHFDTVVSNSTLDHFPTEGDIDRGLRELHRVLRPGGRLVISLDNRANPVIALRGALPFELLRRLGLSPFVVGATLTPAGLVEHLRAAGFAVEDDRLVMHAPRVAVVHLCRALDRRAGSVGRARFLRTLRAAERAATWRSRALTGYYAAALAVKPADR